MPAKMPAANSAFDRPRFRNVVEMFWHAVDNAPDRTALIEGARSISYGDYGAAAAALGNILEHVGVESERVGIILPNSIEANVAIFAGWIAGAQVALLNPGYGVAELARLIEIATPKILIVARQNEAVARTVADQAGIAHVLILGEGELSLDALMKADAVRPRIPIGLEDMATLMFTGGTTGVPKGVDRSHARLIKVIEAMHSAWLTRIDDEVWLNVAPVFHVWGSMMGLLKPVYGRSALVIIPQFQPSAVLKAIEDRRVTVFSGGPAAIYVGLLAMPEFDSTDFSSLRICPGGGSPFLMETLRDWEARAGIPILEAFGMTEGGVISANPLDGRHRYGTVGRPLPGVELSIVALDDPERELPAGEAGEIRIRGPQVVHQYRGQDDGHPDGWLYTGDVGVFDGDGFLRLVDRTKNMLIVSGFNVYPREIEEVLAQHPAVADVAVVGIPDERTGEAPVAFVTLLEGAAIDASSLAHYCAERLVRYRQPKWVRIVDRIPKTPTNKTCRNTLLALVERSAPGVEAPDG
jgi:long-chain acyl-CoA synthetase